MAHVLKVIPTYNNDGQKFIEHRAFILHVIFKEDIFYNSAANRISKRESDSKGNWLKSLCVHQYIVYISCLSTLCVWLN